MTYVRMERYFVNPEKSEEYHAIIEKWTGYMKKNREKCKELKSWRLFSQTIGDHVGEFMELWEVESLAGYERLMDRLMQDREFQPLASKFYRVCLMPATYSVSVWNSIT